MVKRICLFWLVFAALPALAANVPGIKNFDQVDAHVFRGAQPSTEGLQYLAGIGVKTVIDLRETGNRTKEEERFVTRAGMVYLNVPMAGFGRPTKAELLKILPSLENAADGPVFVHCRRGADRTGSVIAAYHIEHDHWDNLRALRDAKAHGMSILQVQRKNFVQTFRPLATAATLTTTPAAVRQ